MFCEPPFTPTYSLCHSALVNHWLCQSVSVKVSTFFGLIGSYIHCQPDCSSSPFSMYLVV